MGHSGPALTIGLKDVLGAEFNANATALAPGAKDGHVTARPCLFPFFNLLGGWFRHFLRWHG
jgi:hypothetical protein